MSELKDLGQYFETGLDSIRNDFPLTFDVFLYFRVNKHIIPWRRKGEVPTKEMIEKLGEKGVKKVFILNSDRDAFLTYAKSSLPEREAQTKPQKPKEQAVVPENKKPPKEPAPPVAAPFIPPAPTAGAVPEVPTFANPESEKLVETLNNKDLSKEERKQIVSDTAKTVLTTTLFAENAELQSKADHYARDTVIDILEKTDPENKPDELSEVWDLSRHTKSFEYSVNVATYAVLLSMAFGREDVGLLAVIAKSSLLHDIGVAWLSDDQIPTSTPKASDLEKIISSGYTKHVDYSIEILKKIDSGIDPTVLLMIEQQHEKFDGSGYPKHLQGFQIDDLAQILSMAVTLEEITSGKWDGVKRSRIDAFEVIEKMEQTRTFPEYFNPEILASVRKWLKDPRSKEASAAASEMVQDQVQGVVRAKKS